MNSDTVPCLSDIIKRVRASSLKCAAERAYLGAERIAAIAIEVGEEKDAEEYRNNADDDEKLDESESVVTHGGFG